MVAVRGRVVGVVSPAAAPCCWPADGQSLRDCKRRSVQYAMTAALETVYQQLQLQSYMLSINDAFFITTSVTITAIFVVLIFVRDPKKKKSTARKEHSALVRVGIEGDGRQMPVLVGPEVDGGFEPIAPTGYASARQFDAFLWAFGDLHGFGADVLPGTLVLDRERDEGAAQCLGQRIAVFRKTKQMPENPGEFLLFALTLWFPQEHRGRMIGLFMIASAIANAVGAAIGGILLDLDGTLGFKGWQWVFLCLVPGPFLGALALRGLPRHN